MTDKSREMAKSELATAAADGLKLISNAADSALKAMAQRASDALHVMTDSAAAQLKIVGDASVVAARAVDVKTSENNEAIIRIEMGIKALQESVKKLETADESRRSLPAFTSAHEMRIIGLEASRGTQITLNGICIGLLSLLCGLMFYHMIK